MRDFVISLEARGVRLSIKPDGDLKLNARTGTLTPADLAAVKAHKPALLAYLAAKAAGQPALLTSGDELRIPTNAPAYQRWWQGGQSLWRTLEELGAPLKTWRDHALKRDDLVADAHRARCSGIPKRGNGFLYCVDCGAYQIEQEERESNDVHQ